MHITPIHAYHFFGANHNQKSYLLLWWISSVFGYLYSPLRTKNLSFSSCIFCTILLIIIHSSCSFLLFIGCTRDTLILYSTLDKQPPIYHGKSFTWCTRKPFRRLSMSGILHYFNSVTLIVPVLYGISFIFIVDHPVHSCIFIKDIFCGSHCSMHSNIVSDLLDSATAHLVHFHALPSIHSFKPSYYFFWLIVVRFYYGPFSFISIHLSNSSPSFHTVIHFLITWSIFCLCFIFVLSVCLCFIFVILLLYTLLSVPLPWLPAPRVLLFDYCFILNFHQSIFYISFHSLQQSLEHPLGLLHLFVDISSFLSILLFFYLYLHNCVFIYR